MQLNPDYSDLLSAFVANRVRFLLVGAYALAYHGRPRATGDMDVWVEPTLSNAKRVFVALAGFGAPLAKVRAEDFAEPHSVFQIGVEPNRIDILTSLTGLTFPEAWRNRRRMEYGPTPVFVLSLKDLLKNKRALGRLRDLADAEEIEALIQLSRRRQSSRKKRT